jgi:hypothetical protein
MAQKTKGSEKMTFLEKFTTWYWVTALVSEAIAIFACFATNFNPWVIGGTLIYTLVALLLVGHFSVLTIFNSDLANLQAQVAITQAEMEMSIPERQKIGFQFDSAGSSSGTKAVADGDEKVTEGRMIGLISLGRKKGIKFSKK